MESSGRLTIAIAGNAASPLSLRFVPKELVAATPTFKNVSAYMKSTPIKISLSSSPAIAAGFQ